jgi:hypothetical protein
MQITFKAIGLQLVADVSYSPGKPATMYRHNGDPGDPAEPSECIITRLWHGVTDASFLLSSDVGDQIADAAHEAADDAWPEAQANADRVIDAFMDSLK